MLKGFKEFIVRGNVVDLAVAFIMGSAFTAVVQALVKDLMTPLIGAVAGTHDFSTMKFKLHHSVFLYGDFINAAVSFLLVAATLYFVVVMPLNKLAERRARFFGRKPAADPVAQPTELDVLGEIRDLLRQAPRQDQVAPRQDQPAPRQDRPVPEQPRHQRQPPSS